MCNCANSCGNFNNYNPMIYEIEISKLLLDTFNQNLKWAQIIKLARKLPTGDVSAMKAGGTNQEEPLDEDDLT